MNVRQKITPFLWYNNTAEEAVTLYVSLFNDSRIVSTTRYGAGGPGRAGSVMIVKFQLAGLEFVALNGGPVYQLTEAFSLSVDCESQAEVDSLWAALSDGGTPGRCGWLKDRFGLSWQIIPSELPRLMSDPDASKSQRVVAAMMQMTKIDIEGLRRAYDGT